MKVCIHTLGCKVNSYESDTIAQYCLSCGHTVSNTMCVADMYIINTCAITGVAEHKSRQAVAKASRLNSSAPIIVVGCAGAKNSSQFEGASAVYGTSDRNKVYQHIDNVGNSVLPLSTKTRTFVKIQDGCNRFCSYCIVPYLRGRSTSRTIDDIVAEVELSSAQEIVLIGIDISQYGSDIGTSLPQLISSLSHIKSRIRLGSLEPTAITSELIDSLHNINWCRQVHLSLQSGSDSVLLRMNRHYTTQQYSQAVQLLRHSFGDVAITTDIIVGFAEESQDEFDQTVQFVEHIGFANVHVFPYSPREGTVAYSMDRVDSSVVSSRVDKLIAVRNQLMYSYLDSHIGQTVEVLAERAPAGSGKGYTSNYMLVKWQGASQRGQMVQVKLTHRCQDYLVGELL